MPILCPEAAAEHDLFNLLRQSSLDCDSNAPIYVKRSDIDRWESTRNDLRICAEQGDMQRRSIIIRSLSRLLIDKRRKEYFQNADNLRTHGRTTGDLAELHQNPARLSIYANTSSPAADIASLLESSDHNASEDALYIERLVAYQASARGLLQHTRSSPLSWPITEDELASTELSEETPKVRCLLCPKTPKNMSALSQHYDRVHKATLSGPFHCPECDNHTVQNWNDWAAHIASYHGAHNAPRRRATVQISCLLCQGIFASVNGLSRHTAQVHQRQFEKPFSCPECSEQSIMINSLSEWCSHVAASHGGDVYAPRPPPSAKRRCLLCEREVFSEQNHYTRHHRDVFDKEFPCPECIRHEADDVPLITSRDDWQLHCIAVHGRTTVVYGQQKYDRCLACSQYFAKVSDHFTKHHMQAFPFSCPECEKSEGSPDGFTIQDRESWVLHCAVVHKNIAAALSSQTENTHNRKKNKRDDDLAWVKSEDHGPQ